MIAPSLPYSISSPVTMRKPAQQRPLHQPSLLGRWGMLSRWGMLGRSHASELIASLAFGIGYVVCVTHGTVASAQPPVDTIPEPSRQTQSRSEESKGEAVPSAARRERDEYYNLLSLFAEALDQIDRNYVESISRRELMEGAIDGMLRKLDQHSSYIPPQEVDELRTEVESEFGGLGIRITARGGTIQVISPLHNTPAYKAGILAGDSILSIDDKSTEGMSSDEAVRLLKGPVGSQVKLEVLHDGRDEPVPISVERAIVRLDSVVGLRRHSDHQWDYFVEPEEQIGYVRITSFTRHTGQELHDVVARLARDGAVGLVVDLRFNPGGLLSAAVEVADLFLDEGRIVSTAGRNIRERSWDATPANTFRDLRLALLVNRFSASASEIVAAALQDHDRAIIVGERTWGKASVQNIIELEGGGSALKLTTAGYRRPSGKNIQRFPHSEETDWGVEPNSGMLVQASDDELYQLRQRHYDLDILRGAERRAALAEVSDGETQESTEWDDRQLNKAVDYLTSQLARR